MTNNSEASIYVHAEEQNKQPRKLILHSCLKLLAERRWNTRTEYTVQQACAKLIPVEANFVTMPLTA
jgi:hypothetical protein